jgi:aspartyl-tRNA(Asn)/glutamyl-tRNA(Gln) amidotransferase subunit A
MTIDEGWHRSPKGNTAMDKPPLNYQTIVDLAHMLRAGEISSTELVQNSLDRIQSLDGQMNAFRLVCSERALKQAQAADQQLSDGKDPGILCGIPYAAKDLFDVKGLPTTAGSSLLEKNIAAEDAHAIRSLTRAGMILLGKTNTVQFAYGGVGINHDHGTPHNPWSSTHHVPGGSSSGSAVAVSAGMVPLALGSDTGGSVRIPAALCGITGLKTTIGRIGRGGVYPLSWSLDSVGILARSVEDTALAYQVQQGADRRDENTWGLVVQEVLGELKTGIRGIRLAFAESAFWQDVHPEIDKAVRECGRVFKKLGATVGSIEFEEAEQARQLNSKGLIIAAEAYALNKRWLEAHFEQLDPIVAQRMIKGKTVETAEYLQNNLAWRNLRSKAFISLEEVDALIVPTTVIPALPTAEVDADMETYTRRNLIYLRNTSIGNVLNLCGLSVPCGFTQEGMPIGLMIYAKPFQENVALRAGYAFQQVTDWHRHTPDISWAGS